MISCSSSGSIPLLVYIRYLSFLVFVDEFTRSDSILKNFLSFSAYWLFIYSFVEYEFFFNCSLVSVLFFSTSFFYVSQFLEKLLSLTFFSFDLLSFWLVFVYFSPWSASNSVKNTGPWLNISDAFISFFLNASYNSCSSFLQWIIYSSMLAVFCYSVSNFVIWFYNSFKATWYFCCLELFEV